MKTNSKFFAWALAASALVGAVGTACTSEETDGLLTGSNVVSLVKAPDIVAYSGDVVLGNTFAIPGVTRGTDMNANMWNQTWDCPPRPAEDLTPEELAELKELLSKGVETHNDIVLPFENYYVQQIYKGEDTYNTHDRCYQDGCDHVNDGTELGSGHMDKLGAWNGTYTKEWDEWKWNPETNQTDQIHHSEEAINYEHINNFNSGTNKNVPGACGCGVSHFGTTLMTDMPTTGFGPDEQFSFHESWGTDHYYNNYYIVYYKGYYYVGFDYEAHKPDQNTHNHGEGLDIERDWNFTDWIVRITPAYPKGTTPETPTDPDPETPETPEVGEPCPGCGHDLTHHDGEHQGGTCSDCAEAGTLGTCFEVVIPGEGETIDPGFTGPTGPDVNIPEDLDPGFGVMPEIPEFKDEVEVNLHADDKDKQLQSHLSIHVRAATDVEIFIPVPEKFYCEADDMMISQIHDKNHSVHGGPYQTTYVLEDKEDGPYTVTLNIEFVEDGIRIWTDGITQEVIDFCYKHYKDGINFEVWNYFEDDLLDLEGLKEYLNQATVRFLDKEPDAYINGFNEAHVGDGVQEPNDCTVNIVEDQAGDYDYLGKGEHKNASHFNDIYAKKGAEEKPATPPTPVY